MYSIYINPVRRLFAVNFIWTNQFSIEAREDGGEGKEQIKF